MNSPHFKDIHRRLLAEAARLRVYLQKIEQVMLELEALDGSQGGEGEKERRNTTH